MNPQQIIEQAKTKFTTILSRFEDELKKLRTGRSSAAMLDGITVMAYGVPTPIKQVANITAPEAQMIQLTPFDPSNIQAISSAIRDNASLGLNPSDDGRVIRVPVPPLNEERRREISKMVGTKLEDCMIAMRQCRHEAIDAIDAAKKDKSIGEDEAKRLSTQIEELMNKMKLGAETAAKAKETEIMTV